MKKRLGRGFGGKRRAIGEFRAIRNAILRDHQHRIERLEAKMGI